MSKKNVSLELLKLTKSMFCTPIIIAVSTYCAVYIFSIIWGSILGDWTPFKHHQEYLAMLLGYIV
jgi:hypothetical protein